MDPPTRNCIIILIMQFRVAGSIRLVRHTKQEYVVDELDIIDKPQNTQHSDGRQNNVFLKDLAQVRKRI